MNSKDKYVALFNASPAPAPSRRRGAPQANPPAPADLGSTEPARISLHLTDIGFSGVCQVRDLWARKDLGSIHDAVSATVNSHGAVLLRVHPEN